MRLTAIDDCLAEACMVRAAHLFVSEIRGEPYAFRPLVVARADVWAGMLGWPEAAPVGMTWAVLVAGTSIVWEGVR